MDTSLDQQQQQPRFKHFCKICKRGFGCGRALGGHMRAHGIGDENGHIEDNDTISDWEDKFGGNPPPGTKCMYVLRTNPNRLKSCRICENCGKEFSSWKSFLEHGKCRSADVESFMSSPRSDDEDEGLRGNGWSKGKRSKRGKVGSFVSNWPLSEDEDLANCLVMLSTARVDPLIVETKESCASARKEDERQNPLCTMPPIFDRGCNNKATNKDVPKGMFECKACKKVFNSHQALGGHRASHKKVKGCYAAKLDDVDESAMGEDVITNDGHSFLSKSTSVGPLESTSQPQLATNSRKKSKIHECTICHRIFLSGQALGGHKRCHWQTSNSPVTSSIAKFHPIQEYNQKPTFEKTASLDLNLPAPADNGTGVPEDHQNPLNFQVLPEVYLQPWIAMQGIEDNDNHGNTINTVIDSSMLSMEDGTNGKVKLAKLSDLKDIRIGNGSSPWLQVGIGSTSNLSNKT